jgi:hypothetical protein
MVFLLYQSKQIVFSKLGNGALTAIGTTLSPALNGTSILV